MASILVIDDEFYIREILFQALSRAGYNVSCAANGKVAINIMKEKKFSLIITDLIMPEKEGIETIIEVKSSFPDLKIIAISGGGRGSPYNYLNIAKNLGAHKVFEKPFDLNEILLAVKNLIGDGKKDEVNRSCR